MKFNFISVFFLAILSATLLLVFAPMVDHLFYIDHKLDKSTDLEIFITILIHIILLGILIYIFHYYVVKKYIKSDMMYIFYYLLLGCIGLYFIF